MSHPQLDNLVRIGRLHVEPPDEAEVQGLLRSGVRRLADAIREDLSLDSRFDLAYNAAHALALAALRYQGYRCQSRYLVFNACSTRLVSRRNNGAYSTKHTANGTSRNTKAKSMSMSNSPLQCCASRRTCESA